MQLYLMRHGAAEDLRPGITDEERRLTPEGAKKVKAGAAALKRLDLKVDVIVSSPLPRALETAEIVADALGLHDALRVDARLAGGLGLGELQEIVGENPGVERLMLVGHNPDMPMIAARLVGGGRIDMKKGGLIRVDTPAIEPGAGSLVWLLAPAVLTNVR